MDFIDRFRSAPLFVHGRNTYRIIIVHGRLSTANAIVMKTKYPGPLLIYRTTLIM